MRRALPAILLVALRACVAGAPADASETISYSYDAQGRLIQVSHSGTVNSGLTTTYTYDKAHNRVTKSTTSSPNPPPP